MKVLIVEDRKENREAAAEVFADDEVEFAITLSEAENCLDKSNFDGVILDGQFPRATGEEPKELGIKLGREIIKSNTLCCLVSAFERNPGNILTKVQGMTAFQEESDLGQQRDLEQAGASLADTNTIRVTKDKLPAWKLARQYLLLEGRHCMQSAKVEEVVEEDIW